MAALRLLANQSTQLARVDSSPVTSAAMPAIAPAATTTTYAGLSAPVYPYQRECQHPLLSGVLRRGKWTAEEEKYAATIIRYFLSGVLPIQYGTTLRGYIAQLLHCDPMRVSKKLIPGTVFVDVRIDPKIGRRSYYPCPMDTAGLDEHKEKAERHLAELRAQFIASIEREELHDQHGKTTPDGSSFTNRRSISPLLLKEAQEMHGPSEMQETAKRDLHHHTPSLPSITELLRQNRLRVPSPVMAAADSHSVRASTLQYASPPHQSWQPSQRISHVYTPPRENTDLYRAQYAHAHVQPQLQPLPAYYPLSR